MNFFEFFSIFEKWFFQTSVSFDCVVGSLRVKSKSGREFNYLTEYIKIFLRFPQVSVIHVKRKKSELFLYFDRISKTTGGGHGVWVPKSKLISWLSNPTYSTRIPSQVFEKYQNKLVSRLIDHTVDTAIISI